MNDPTTLSPAAATRDYERRLREMNDPLLMSSVRQHELIEQAQRAEAALRESEQRLALELAATRRLQEVSTQLIREENVEALYKEILEAAVAIMDSDMASVQILDKGRDALRLLAWRGFGPAFVKIFEFVGLDTKTSCSRARSVGQRVVVPDVETCDFIVDTPALEDHRKTGIRAAQSTPLFSRGGQLVGMISTHWRQPHQPSERDLRLLDVLARQAADLIERSETEKALRQSEERFRAMADSSPIMIWVTDAKGDTSFLNRTYLDYLGFVGEPANGDLALNIHPDDRNAYVAAFQTDSQRHHPFQQSARIRRHDGQWRWFESRGNPIVDAADRLTGYIGSSSDITEIYESRQALKDRDQRKDEFLALLGHELRNPLTPISSGLEILKLTGNDSETADNVRSMMEQALTQMVRLVDDLLDASRITTGKLQLRKERVELATVMQSVVDTSRPFIEEHGQKLTIELPSAPILLDADPIRLAQVFLNLLNNAAKYSEAGGHIALSAEAEDDQIVVRVTDTGIGILADHLPRIFEIFAQVDTALEKSQGGLGIGLSLAKGLVEMHGGRIAAHSNGPGLGSEFIVHLPIVVAEPLPKSAPNADAKASATAKRRILIVDDNLLGSQGTGMVLHAMGHEVATAHDGIKGMEQAQTFRPDVILLDIGLPGLNGLETARCIRAQPWGKNIFLIAVTGYGQDQDRRRSQEAGFDHHMVKPIDFAELKKKLAEFAGPDGGQA
ncbi:MAG: ATP-binding protein [Candidatus Binatia bacterium]